MELIGNGWVIENRVHRSPFGRTDTVKEDNLREYLDTRKGSLWNRVEY